ncbi:unnamed protein product [Rotaria magnacalcarata]|uniref:DAGKc domain-containing protein n=2 Tax=Rotaria magnacalcarata TaxID=392030 RepID=A0A816MK24_9BILA|nr:unnamed protein product [Rotaria magnacalcarata]CAF1438571.1 unnamed protein product [Rotaria magnacalcarata]CAF2002894.1 unnamed protein product [Rotaria magnacalcarata]CAF3859974.1 unnamed protein product [Rotaria magnacalcarata]CAF3899396.1 unnamed protein product [Rotaria magnacalcarata]
MPSILYSTICYIKDDFYRLRIYVDDPNDCFGRDSKEDDQFKNDSFEFTPTNIPIDYVKPSFTRLNFQLLNEKNTNNNIPETITLNHLLNVQQTTPLSRKSNKNLTQSVQTPSPERSTDRNTNSICTSILSQPGDTTQTTLTSNNSEVLFKHKQFSFRSFFSSLSNPNSGFTSLLKTLVKIKYVDVSNSIQWKVKSLELELDTEDVAYELYLNLNLCLSILKQRPHRLLAFVNPLSGKGRAQSIYLKKVLPIFQEANIIVDTIYTERANHAQEYVINEIIDDYDGLICVGGDGMFAELCHGLLLRTARDEQINIDNPRVDIIRPNLRIGIIPAGSTDAVVFGTTGLNDPITSALQIIVGESLLIDITTVHNENGFVRFMATMLAYGFFGDIIHQSDNWRCLGPLRYDLAGFCQFLRHTSYHSELTIALSTNDQLEICDPQEMKSTKIENEPSSIVSDCQQLITNSPLSEVNPMNKLMTPNLSFCRRNCDRCAEQNEIDSHKNNVPLQVKLDGRYTTINCLNMPCRCAKSKYGMSPFVHLGDGTFDLILVKRSWRTSFLRFLWQVANDGRSIEDLPNVEKYRVREVLIRPIVKDGKQAGNWACDGELINGNEIQIRAHRQALNIFASGIQLKEKQINLNTKNETINCFHCLRCKNGKIAQESNS